MKKEIYLIPNTKVLVVRFEGNILQGSFDSQNGTEKYGEDPDVDI